MTRFWITVAAGSALMVAAAASSASVITFIAVTVSMALAASVFFSVH